MKTECVGPRSKAIFALTLPILLSFAFAAAPAFASEAPQADCDRLAGDAVQLEAIDASKAVPVCAAAVAASPQTPRLEYAYGRALEKAGRIDDAKGMYQWAADDGFAPATAALSRLSAQATPSTSTATADDKKGRAQLALRMDAIADVAQRISSAAPRDHDDPIAVLAKTGTDPAAILTWVRDNTRLVPYFGMLRGSSGVLMDRAGNSLDRALLLADLLHRAGYEVRLARAHVDAQTAAALRARVEASIPKSIPPSSPDRAELLGLVGENSQLDRATVERAVDETIAANRRFNESVKNLYGAVYPAVMAAVGDDTKRDQKLVADAETKLRDHFWVQRRGASGWEDLDPDADIVNRLAPSETLAPDQIPDALKHRVTLRVILETWSAGTLSETMLLEHAWTPSDLIGKSITLTHILFPQDSIEQIVRQPDAKTKFVDGLAKAWVIEPTLQVGTEMVTQQLYTLGGQVLPATTATLARLGVANTFANFGKLENGIDQAFGAPPRDSQNGQVDEGTAPVKVTAEWIEFQIDTPDEMPERHRRSVFDLIGPAMRARTGQITPPSIDSAVRERRASALVGIVDVYIFGATPAVDWTSRTAALGLAGIVREVAASVRSGDAPPTHSERLLIPLWSWALGRSDTGLVPEGALVRPNVAVLWNHFDLRRETSNGDRVVFDIVANDLVANMDFRDRVAQGVLDTVIEHALLDDGTAADNAAALMSQDIGDRRPWTWIEPTNSERALKSVEMSADSRAALMADLAEGDFVLVSPLATSKSGNIWWRVNPRTGMTLGVDGQGRGAAMADYGLVLNELLWDVCAFKTVKAAIAGNAGGVAMGYLCMAGAGLGIAGYIVTGSEALGALGVAVSLFSQVVF